MAVDKGDRSNYTVQYHIRWAVLLNNQNLNCCSITLYFAYPAYPEQN